MTDHLLRSNPLQIAHILMFSKFLYFMECGAVLDLGNGSGWQRSGNRPVVANV